MSIACGICLGAIGATAAHELLHRRTPLDLLLSVWQLCSSFSKNEYPLLSFSHSRQIAVFGYGHYFSSHRHHHFHVGTPDDAATTDINERADNVFSYGQEGQ